MNEPSVLTALILGIVEGITEFLPISSTGHLILAGHLLNFTGPKANLFEIVIQSGAIAAVLWEYRQRFVWVIKGVWTDRLAQRFVVNIALAFMPLAVLGLRFKKELELYLFKPVPVALAFIVGGIIILWVERKGARDSVPRVSSVDEVNAVDALKLGFIQALALFPGTSRSGATIIGGMMLGLSRRAAAEFSFFLAVPTLLGATAYKLYKEHHLLSASDAGFYAVGMLVSFISALVVIRVLIRFVSGNTFIPFAWYRIAFGIVVLLTAHFGWVNWNAH
jgi:undecaprenyl-diphosphatase